MSTADIQRIASRKTFDGRRVDLHSDGACTWAMGQAIKGAWLRPTAAQKERALDAGWLALGEVEISDAAEVPEVMQEARKVIAQAVLGRDFGGLPGKLRTRLHARRMRSMFSPQWVVLSADARGTATERVWRLPSLGQWAGVAVFDKMHGSDRMSAHHRVAGSRDTFAPSGFTFANQIALFTWLADNPTTAPE